jgi:ribonuclease P protein component
MKKSLTRRERLSGKRDIEALFKQAERFEGGGVRLLVRPNGQELNRMLVTVRRGFKNAPARNRQKRILREIYRDSKKGLKQGFDLAFILTREESSFNDVRLAVTRLLRQAGLSGG